MGAPQKKEGREQLLVGCHDAGSRASHCIETCRISGRKEKRSGVVAIHSGGKVQSRFKYDQLIFVEYRE